jgi:CRP-like cAMP-binding protein
MDVKSFLRSIPEFGQLRDEDLNRAAAIARVGSVKANEMVDVQGQPADKLYILVSGRLGVVLDLDLGVSRKSYVVTTIGPGHMFAWSGIIGNPHYTAGSRALTDSTFLEFDVRQLEQAFAEDPQLGYVVMRAVAQTIASRLRAMQLQLVQQYALSQVE